MPPSRSRGAFASSTSTSESRYYTQQNSGLWKAGSVVVTVVVDYMLVGEVVMSL